MANNRAYFDLQDWYSKNGFNEDGVTYCVAGENTYPIKDKLKELGFCFNSLLKWHASQKVDLPEGYKYIIFNFNELYDWDEKEKQAYFYESAEVLVKERFDKSFPTSNSEYMGTLKERLRNITVKYKGTKGFNGVYGYTYIHTFECQENILIWFTKKELNFEIGEALDLTGTVVNHEEFRGTRITKVNRCVIRKIEIN